MSNEFAEHDLAGLQDLDDFDVANDGESYLDFMQTDG